MTGERSAAGARFGPVTLSQLIVGALIVAAIAFFVVQNTEDVAFDYLWLSLTAPLWLMALVFTALGALLALVLGWRRRARRP